MSYHIQADRQIGFCQVSGNVESSLLCGTSFMIIDENMGVLLCSVRQMMWLDQLAIAADKNSLSWDFYPNFQFFLYHPCLCEVPSFDP